MTLPTPISLRHSSHLMRIDQQVQAILQRKSQAIESAGICLETDLSPVSSSSSGTTLLDAIEALIENAIQSMSEGGELSITLIDSPSQWELEVADTSQQERPINRNAFSHEPAQIIPLPATDGLRTAYRLTFQLGGEIQTWNCPLGGQAHVMVIPKPYQTRRHQST